MVALANDVLSGLCSTDQLALLDAIDQLRLQGINNYISLPQIVVCGDQSSGKSSVLEAISGVSFPIKGNLCTRFPTEVVLRRASHLGATVSIIPHKSRSDSEQETLRSFREKLSGLDDLPKLVESAKLALGITTHGRAFASDILRIEITGPDRPHLTIVDLPGLIHAETKSQTSSDVELIKDVVKSYMREPRCIILAVVSAKNDFANQVVLKLAQDADRGGNRTLGIITKPDTLTPGSESEALYASLARNHEVEFRHGWHVLKNMDSEKGSWSLSDRDAEEVNFFGSGVWNQLPLSSLGVDKLRGRLSKVLLGQIATELPSLVDEIQAKYEACQRRLEKLGDSRCSSEEQLRYLLRLSQTFQLLIKASIDGNYNNPFFGDALTDTGYQQRIRAVIQNLNEEFAADIWRRGRYRGITNPGEQSSASNVSADSHGVISITTDDFISHIEHRLRRTRGCELPGTFNPMIVADLFFEQSQPWEAIARRHVEKAGDAAFCSIKLVIEHMADASTAKALQLEVFEPAMKKIMEEMREKTTELLNPHRNGHPITYNHYFTETLQKIRRTRWQKKLEAVLKTTFSVDQLVSNEALSGRYNLRALAENLANTNEPDMNRFAANEALDYLSAYYKVALKRFIDDVAVEVIEAKLISRLDKILYPVSVFEMPPSQVANIAGESEESRTEREQLTKEVEVLRMGLTTCKSYVGFRISEDAALAATKKPGIDGSRSQSVQTPGSDSQESKSHLGRISPSQVLIQSSLSPQVPQPAVAEVLKNPKQQVEAIGNDSLASPEITRNSGITGIRRKKKAVILF